MNDVQNRLSQAREVFKNVAFHIGAKEISEKEIHSMVIEGLEILSDIKNLISTKKYKDNQGEDNEIRRVEQRNRDENNEIKKVESRLKLWGKPERQHQINARILNAFLALKRSGNDCITAIDIQNKLPDDDSIQSNLQQMTNIAEKNHGKIFEQNINCIEIWEPVSSFVSEYEQAINFA